MDTLYTFWENITHYKTESVHFLGLMNSATKLWRWGYDGPSGSWGCVASFMATGIGLIGGCMICQLIVNVEVGVSENRGPLYRTLNGRILIRTPK